MNIWAVALTVGGRLVFLAPAFTPEQAEAQFAELLPTLSGPDDEVTLWELEAAVEGPGEGRLLRRVTGGEAL